MNSTIRGHLADRACGTTVSSYQFETGSWTELRIQVMELLFYNAYLLKVINDKKSCITQMEVLDLIYH
jgi:hypothetical protein